MTDSTISSVKAKRTATRSQKRLLFYVLMFALPLLQFAIFYVYVNFNSIIIAFQEQIARPGVGTGYDIKPSFTSFEWAFQQFFSAESGLMLWRSIQLLLCQLVIVIPLALLFSYYIAKEKPGAGFFRIMLYLPQVVSVVVLGILFKYLVSQGYPVLMKQLFEEKVIGLLLPSTSADSNFYTALIFTIWFSFGANVLIFTGAMSGVDQSIVESAQLDGVSNLQEFFFIYVPMIFNTVTTFIITGLAGIFNNQMNLHVFFNNTEGNVDVFGYYFYRMAALCSEDYNGVYGEVDLRKLAALGLIATLLLVPTVLLVRKLLDKYGPSAD